MGPLDLRAEVQAVSPLARARLSMERAEVAEQRQRDAEAYAKEARAEAIQMQIVSRQRVELMRDGETTEDRLAREAAQREHREARIAALTAELDRLDPNRPRVQRQSQFYIEHQIARSREVSDRGRMLIARMQRRDREEQELRRAIDPG